jgi:hypothetical protein
MNTKRPPYAALDSNGSEYTRPARTISELPTPEVRLAALDEATKTVAAQLNLNAKDRIKFGTPLYEAFMTAPEASFHPMGNFLFTQGADISLDLCPSYN